MRIQYMTDKNRIIIFDTTMRDGEQSPGASMSLEEKLQISRVFDELGVDVIEAGFPIASPGDFEAVTEISKTLKRSINSLDSHQGGSGLVHGCGSAHDGPQRARVAVGRQPVRRPGRLAQPIRLLDAPPLGVIK